MKVVHLSSHDQGAGAAIAAYRLHCGLRRLNVDSTMFVMQRRGNDPSVQALAIPMDPLARLRRWLIRKRIQRDFARYWSTRPTGYEQFSDDRSEYGALPLRQLPPCDVINLHWVARFVDYQAFLAAIPRHIPLVWRLADMAAFTSGCHYDHGCGRFTEQCGACPQLGSNDPKDLSFQIWQRKQAALSQIAADRLHIVATSRWNAAEVQRSSLLGRYPVTIIPNGLNTDEFAPRDRQAARDVLGIPQEAAVALFVAGAVTNRRKGLPLLFEALANVIGIPNMLLVSMGAGTSTMNDVVPHLHLGYIGNDRLRSMVYSAADVFVIPSLQESFGQTVIEAIACGTPVVGFAVGGIPDMVRPGITGLLVSTENVLELRDAISAILQNPVLRAEMSQNCRRIAVAEYSFEIQSRSYIELYRSLIRSAQGRLAGLPDPTLAANEQ
jgi:glycosyltransferase involved in cell wall biosynthesis